MTWTVAAKGSSLTYGPGIAAPKQRHYRFRFMAAIAAVWFNHRHPAGDRYGTMKGLAKRLQREEDGLSDGLVLTAERFVAVNLDDPASAPIPPETSGADERAAVAPKSPRGDDDTIAR